MNFIENIPKNLVAYTLKNEINPKKEWKFVALIFNSGDLYDAITLTPAKDTYLSKGYSLPDQWVVIENKEVSSTKPLAIITDWQ